MSYPTTEPTHVRVLLFLTWFGISLGLFLLAMVTAMQFSVATVDPTRDVLDGPFDNITVGALIGLVLCSLVVQVWVRLARGQRRLAVMLLELQSARPFVAHAYVGRATVTRRRDDDADTVAIEKGPRRSRRRRTPRTLDMDGLSPDIIETARSLSDRLGRQPG